MALLKFPALSRKMMVYTTVSLGQPGVGGAKHFLESIALIRAISPLMSSYLPCCSMFAEAKLPTQVSLLSIKKTLKPRIFKQVLSPVLKLH